MQSDSVQSSQLQTKVIIFFPL